MFVISHIGDGSSIHQEKNAVGRFYIIVMVSDAMAVGCIFILFLQYVQDAITFALITIYICPICCAVAIQPHTV